jgi:hypothetical protein
MARLARRFRLLVVCFAIGAATAPDVARASYAEHAPAPAARVAPAPVEPVEKTRAARASAPLRSTRRAIHFTAAAAAGAPPAAICRTPIVRKRWLEHRVLRL